jgi:hypothetical protein
MQGAVKTTRLCRSRPTQANGRDPLRRGRRKEGKGSCKEGYGTRGRYLMMARLAALEEQGQKSYDGIPGIAWLEFNELGKLHRWSSPTPATGAY